jgi:formate hydrogenlyase subunit 3/multisubunit Na+/H+ antiporter MnhD subunit
MDAFRELGRLLLMLGGLLVVVGAFFYFGGKLPFRLGRFPGDIVYKGDHTTFYFPIVTCIVLSIGLSLLFWLLSRFRR